MCSSDQGVYVNSEYDLATAPEHCIVIFVIEHPHFPQEQCPYRYQESTSVFVVLPRDLARYRLDTSRVFDH